MHRRPVCESVALKLFRSTIVTDMIEITDCLNTLNEKLRTCLVH